MVQIQSYLIDINNHSYTFHIYQISEEIMAYLHYGNQDNHYYIYLDEHDQTLIEIINNQRLYNSRLQLQLHIMCSNQSQINQCIQLGLKCELQTAISKLSFLKGDHMISYQAHKITTYTYKQTGVYCVYKYYEDNQISIIRIKGLLQNWDLIPFFRNDMFIFVSVPWCLFKSDYEQMLDTLLTQNRSFKKNQIILECCDFDAILWSIEYGFNWIFCNNNAWIDYNLFTITNSTQPRIYDLIMNCRSQTIKRPYLAQGVSNLAFIKNNNLKHDQDYDYTQLSCQYINNQPISQTEVIKLNNQSHCGGIFSEIEGCCYASSEYLLCGLPVISTPSRGGRDIWYTPDNSIIVNNSEEVKMAVNQIVNGQRVFNREQIRQNHINLSHQCRQNFNNYVQTIFDQYQIQTQATTYFNTHYTHLFQRWHRSLTEAVLVLKSNKVQLHPEVISDIFNTVSLLSTSNLKLKPKILVFGLGYDSPMWQGLTQGQTYFVENSDYFIDIYAKTQTTSKYNIIKYQYPTQVKNLKQDLKSPAKCPKALLKLAPFDIIIIDGPCGYDANQCGRFLPIYWSKKSLSQKGQTIIYLDDCQRQLESTCLQKYFGGQKQQSFPYREGSVKIWV